MGAREGLSWRRRHAGEEAPRVKVWRRGGVCVCVCLCLAGGDCAAPAGERTRGLDLGVPSSGRAEAGRVRAGRWPGRVEGRAAHRPRCLKWGREVEGGRTAPRV